MPTYVYLAVYWACLGLGLVALWLGILGGGLLAQIVFPVLSGGLLSILGGAGIVAAIVYLVDVRRRLIEVTRGGSRW